MSTYLKYRPAWMQLLIFASLTIGIFLVVSFVAVLIISRIFNLSPTDFEEMNLLRPDVVSGIKALQAVSSIALFLLPSLVFAYLSDANPLKYIGFKKPIPAGFFLIALVIILASFPMVAWLSEMNQHMHLPKSMQATEKMLRDAEDKSNDLLRTLLNMKSAADLVLMLLILAVLPAVAEELFFRGVLQRLLIQIIKRPWIGIIITSALFSALHGQFLGFFPRMVLGIVLGALYWYSGSLWPGILAHFINNALQIIMVYYNPQFAEKDPNFAVWLIAASTFLVIALTWWMQKISQTSFAEVYDTDDDFPIGPRDQYIA